MHWGPPSRLYTKNISVVIMNTYGIQIKIRPDIIIRIIIIIIIKLLIIIIAINTYNL